MRAVLLGAVRTSISRSLIGACKRDWGKSTAMDKRHEDIMPFFNWASDKVLSLVESLTRLKLMPLELTARLSSSSCSL